MRRRRLSGGKGAFCGDRAPPARFAKAWHNSSSLCRTINPKLLITRIFSGHSACLDKDAVRADHKALVGNRITELPQRERLADLIYAHFADAADIPIKVEEELGIPFLYTAHSLGSAARRYRGSC